MKVDLIKAYNRKRDTAVRKAIENDDYSGLVELIELHPDCRYFFANDEKNRKEILGRMARKMACNLTSFSAEEKENAREWLKDHGSNETIF